MKFRSVDIETVPDMSVWTPGTPQYKVEPGRRVIHRSATDVTSEDILMAVPVDQFPPPQAHRIVAIATADVDMNVTGSPKYRFGGCKTLCEWAIHGDMEDSVELVLLRSFSDALKSVEGTVDIVTWNGRGFDMPVMSMRALKLGIPWGWYYDSKDIRYRYSAEGHFDLMDYLGDFGAGRNMKLGDVARLIGLPGKTGEVSGGNVAEIVGRSKLAAPEEQAAMMKSVGRYCLSDALQTAIIFLRTRYHLGKIDLIGYNAAIDTFSADETVREILPIDWNALKL